LNEKKNKEDNRKFYRLYYTPKKLIATYAPPIKEPTQDVSQRGRQG
jgi:hypothetical protein